MSNEGNPPDGLGFPPDADPPEGLDWDLWIGPGPMRPFNENIVKNGWSHTLFLDYGGGRTCGMANHILDLPFWALEPGLPDSRAQHEREALRHRQHRRPGHARGHLGVPRRDA